MNACKTCVYPRFPHARFLSSLHPSTPIWPLITRHNPHLLSVSSPCYATAHTTEARDQLNHRVAQLTSEKASLRDEVGGVHSSTVATVIAVYTVATAAAVDAGSFNSTGDNAGLPWHALACCLSCLQHIVPCCLGWPPVSSPCRVASGDHPLAVTPYYASITCNSIALHPLHLRTSPYSLTSLAPHRPRSLRPYSHTPTPLHTTTPLHSTLFTRPYLVPKAGTCVPDDRTAGRGDSQTAGREHDEVACAGAQ